MAQRRIYLMEESYLNDYLVKREVGLSSLGDSEESTKGLRTEYNQNTRRIEDNPILTISGEDAHINISGPLSRRGPDWIDALFGFGGTSTIEIIESIQKAEADPTVKNIILDMDTPGGEATGTDEVWQAVAKATKPVTAINQGLVASAGYYIASAADRIVSTSPMNEFGSIGVVVATWDTSKADEANGYRRIVITSDNAPEKRPDISKDSGIEIIRKQINAIERIFYDRVASGRKVTIEYIKEHFGKGGLLTSKDPEGNPDAISVGMIDSLVEDAIDTNFVAVKETAPPENPEVSTVLAPVAQSVPTVNTEGSQLPAQTAGNPKGKKMTLAELKSSDPALYAEVEANAKAEFERGKTEAEASAKSRAEYASTIMSSADYPEVIKNAAAEVIKGARTEQSLKDMVGMYDSLKASAGLSVAEDKTKENPAPAQHNKPTASADPGFADSPEALEELYKEVK